MSEEELLSIRKLINREAIEFCKHERLRHETFYYEAGTRSPTLINWIVNRAVELARDTFIEEFSGDEVYYTSQEVLQQIKKELGEKK